MTGHAAFRRQKRTTETGSATRNAPTQYQHTAWLSGGTDERATNLVIENLEVNLHLVGLATQRLVEGVMDVANGHKGQIRPGTVLRRDPPTVGRIRTRGPRGAECLDVVPQ